MKSGRVFCLGRAFELNENVLCEYGRALPGGCPGLSHHVPPLAAVHPLKPLGSHAQGGERVAELPPRPRRRRQTLGDAAFEEGAAGAVTPATHVRGSPCAAGKRPHLTHVTLTHACKP